MMKKKMWLTVMLTVGLVLAAQPAAAGIFGRGPKGSGDMETRSFDLEPVERVRVDGAFELEIEFGSAQEVEITVDDNLWDLLEAEVSGGTLVLGWRKSCRPDDDCRARLVLQELVEVDIRGASEVEISDFQGKSLTFTCSGAGELDINGRVEDLQVKISGAGEVNARDLLAENVDVVISGAGEASVHANRSLRGRVSGVGQIDYYGDPEDRDTKVSGIGSIKAR